MPRGFANAADFAFLIVGTFDQAAITPLIEQYIGALPSTGKRMSTDKPLNFVFPGAVERIRVEKGKEQKSDTVITFFSDTGGKLDEETIANGAASLLQIRLRDLLREDLGGTYSVSADYSNTLPSPGYGTSTISFGSSPENAEKLTAAVLTEVKRLASEGPTAEDAAKVREQEKRELETSLKQNGYWLGGPADADHAAARSVAARLEPRAHRDDHARAPEGRVSEVLPDEPLHRRDAGARSLPPSRRPHAAPHSAAARRTDLATETQSHGAGAPPSTRLAPRQARAWRRMETRPRLRALSLSRAASAPLRGRCQ